MVFGGSQGVSDTFDSINYRAGKIVCWVDPLKTNDTIILVE